MSERARAACLSSPTTHCVFAMARTLADALADADEHIYALLAIARAQIRAGNEVAARETLVAATWGAQQINDAGGPFGTGRASTLVRIAEMQMDAGDKAGANASLTEAIATTGHIAGALDRAEVLVEIARVQTRMGIDVTVKAAFADAAASAVRSAARIARENDRALALSHIVEAQAGAGDFDGARKTAARISGASWRAVQLRSIAKAQFKAGDDAGGRATFAELIEAIGSVDDDHRRTMNLAYTVEAQAEIGDIDGAMRIARRIGPAYSRAWTFALMVIVSVLSETGDVAAAQEFVKNASPASIPDSALGDIAVAQAAAGDIRGSLQTARAIDGTEERGRVFASISRAQAKAGDIAEALKFAEQINDPYIRAWALHDIAIMRVDAEDDTAVNEILAAALRAVKKIDRPGSGTILAFIAAAQAQAGDVAAALQTAAQIDHGSVQARALRNISVKQCKRGNAAQALQTVKRIDDVPVKTILLVPVSDSTVPRIDNASVVNSRVRSGRSDSAPPPFRIHYPKTQVDALASIAACIAETN